MIYITALRVRSDKEGLGINIELCSKPGQVPSNPLEVPDNLKDGQWLFAQRQVAPQGVSEEALLDFILDDNAYSREGLISALEDLRQHIRENLVPNPFAGWLPRNENTQQVFAIFSVNLDLVALAPRLRVLQELSDSLRRWLERYDKDITQLVQASLNAPSP